MIYQSEKNLLPDRDFEAGSLAHLVVGNLGRMLDPRRTPIMILDIMQSSATFLVKIRAFEDKGAIWAIPFWDIAKFQFSRRSKKRSKAEVLALSKLSEQFRRPLRIECDQATTAKTKTRLLSFQKQAFDWLSDRPEALARLSKLEVSLGKGAPWLQTLCRDWMALHGVENMDAAFAASYASNPNATEHIKGHKMVLAEMGLCPFEGYIQRDQKLFSGQWSKELRSVHILVRMGFVHAFLEISGFTTVPLFRAIYSNSGIDPPRNTSFVSTTFSKSVALALWESGLVCQNAVVAGQKIPVNRLFMTHLETKEFSQRYQEFEAIILFDQENPLF